MVIIKIRKILSHKIGNVITMIVDDFRSTELNWADFDTLGLDPGLKHRISPFSRIKSDIRQKTHDWVKNLMTRDRVSTHIYELSQETLGRLKQS